MGRDTLGREETGAKMNNDQMQAAQRQVNDVVDVMRNNIDKVMERDAKLSDLDHRASNLEASSSMFQQSSGRLRKKYWWSNMKMKLCLIGVGVIIVIIIIIVIVVKTMGDGSSHHDGS